MKDFQEIDKELNAFTTTLHRETTRDFVTNHQVEIHFEKCSVVGDFYERIIHSFKSTTKSDWPMFTAFWIIIHLNIRSRGYHEQQIANKFTMKLENI